MREYRRFVHKEAAFRISTSRFQAATAAIVKQRAVLDAYINLHADFTTALQPIALMPGAPRIAVEMAEAGRACGVGPMAAVAGTMAHCAALAAVAAGADEAIVENGGDIYLISGEPVLVALSAKTPDTDYRVPGLAFRVKPEDMPVAICSSSSRMGHSLSLGMCDLATVVAESGALADAAATLACNRVRTAAEVQPVLERVAAIPGVRGVVIVKDGVVGLAGSIPELVRNRDTATASKTTRRHQATAGTPREWGSDPK